MSSTTQSKIQRYIYLDSIPSTNEFLSLYLSKNNPSGNVCVYSFHQTNGRGQIGRYWYSGIQKNISLSYLVQFRKLAVQDHFKLNMAVSLGLYDSLIKFTTGQKLSIKWPNDIYLSKKKLGGILIQNHIGKSQIKSSIIGIGLNINENRFPHSLPNPISLYQATGIKFPLYKTCRQLIEDIIHRCLYHLEHPEKMRKLYIDRLYGINKELEYIDKTGQLFKAIILGVDEKGKLLLDMNGSIHSFHFHEIQLKPDDKT